MTRVTRLRRSATPESSSAWRERSGRLYEELQRPAQALVRRAFRGAFGDDEIEDISSLGTKINLQARNNPLDPAGTRLALALTGALLAHLGQSVRATS